jgi:Domain of unknown function (DUF4337)
MVIPQIGRDLMNVEEIKENTEHAHHSGERGIGLTMAIVAVLLAVATLLGHRAHTEEIKLLTKVNDGWAFYQAKHSRAHEYGKYAENEAYANQKDLAAKDLKVSIAEECGVPAEAKCDSPVMKDSAVLRQFVKDNAATGEHTEATGAAHLAPTAAHEAGASGKEKPAPEKAGQEKGSKESGSRKEGAVDIQKHTNELEDDTAREEAKADHYDSAELFLEISIVLCSIALLAEAKLYWKLSFLSTAIGVGLALWGWFLR